MTDMVYAVVNRLVSSNNVDLSGAEAHGIATGMLCVNANTQSEYWLSELLGDGTPVSDENRQLLVRLFEETRRLLASDELAFELFLPDDDTSLPQRISALIAWCQGLLFGIGTARLTVAHSSDVREILKDITEFTKLDKDAEGEEDENAFVEITEYLKSAVLLLRDDLISHTPNRVH